MRRFRVGYLELAEVWDREAQTLWVAGSKATHFRSSSLCQHTYLSKWSCVRRGRAQNPERTHAHVLKRRTETTLPSSTLKTELRRC